MCVCAMVNPSRAARGSCGRWQGTRSPCAVLCLVVGRSGRAHGHGVGALLAATLPRRCAEPWPNRRRRAGVLSLNTQEAGASRPSNYYELIHRMSNCYKSMVHFPPQNQFTVVKSVLLTFKNTIYEKHWETKDCQSADTVRSTFLLNQRTMINRPSSAFLVVVSNIHLS
jgi:hypothetical protein